MSSCSASAPGTLMLLGEHAVLEGRLALACAVDTRLQVRLAPQAGSSVTIQRDLGTCEFDLNLLSDPSAPRPGGQAFRFILSAVAAYRNQLPGGFNLQISSDFPETIGFGSSAAVTVASHLVLRRFCDLPTSQEPLFEASLSTVREVQGMGSGTDLAACIHGGVVAYRATPFDWTPLTMSHPITVVYSGHKTPTPDVVRLVQQAKKKHPAKFASIFDAIEDSVLAAIRAIGDHDWQALGRLLNDNQRHMCDMGLCDDDLETIVTYLQQQPGILGAKISGSGLGDCAIGLGTADLSSLPYLSVPSQISDRGAELEEG